MGRRRKKRTVEGAVIDIGAKGMAVSKTDDGEVFMVRDAVPGDRISAILTRKKKGVWVGHVQDILELSENRVEPPCQHFAHCGGCKWQNLNYETQIQLKEKTVRDAMERIGGFPVEQFSPILGCEEIYEYRNKLEFTFSDKRWLTEQEMKSQKTISEREALGFHRPGRFDKILDIQECLLQPAPSNEIRNFIRKTAIEQELSFFNPRSQEGFLRNLIIRTTETGDLMVVLIVKERDENAIHNLLSAVNVAFPEITSLQYVINPKRNDSIFDLDVHPFSGESYITESLGGKRYRIGPKSFFQTNTRQARRLYDQIIRLGEFTGEETLYDLYSGLGSIGIYLAKLVARVIGVEEVGEAVEWARVNADLNQDTNCSFYHGDVRHVLNKDFVEEHGLPDVLIVDPPRAGLHPDVVDFILDLEPKKIIYVSCNPATQARDMALWTSRYQCIAMQPVDMFPHTSHIENVAVLHKKI